VGTILGAVLGGKKGAVVGAVLGGAGAILATEGQDVELPRGTVLRVRLDEELRVGSPSSNE
jgi:outer membrane lipoprotein SlyB